MTEHILRGDLVTPITVRALAATGVLSRLQRESMSTQELATGLDLDPRARTVPLRWREYMGGLVAETSLAAEPAHKSPADHASVRLGERHALAIDRRTCLPVLHDGGHAVALQRSRRRCRPSGSGETP
jgi:hypothetical protein